MLYETDLQPRTVMAVRLFREQASEAERQEAADWLRMLLDIRESQRSDWEKVRDAAEATRRRKIAGRLLSIMRDAAYRWGWRDRSWPARLGFGMMLGTAMTVGGKGAGIVAFGGGIGLPLWIVLGAGGTFAGTILQELQNARTR